MTCALNKLRPLVKKRKRIGRGGSRGGTSGKGHKGQNARSGGGVSPSFEGGQMPLHRRLPKRGFTNARFKKHVEIISVERLDQIFAVGDTVTKELLVQRGVLKVPKGNSPFILKVLGNGTLAKKLIIHADAFSKSAMKAIEDVGGEPHLIKGA